MALPAPTGEIVWDVDWNHHALTGVYKLCIIDTGVGMTGEEMVRYINQLSSSMHEQSHAGNFGVGAKIAAATRNHAGLVYVSWKHGIGSMIQLWRDPDSGEYGLLQFEHPDGAWSEQGQVEAAVRPRTPRTRPNAPGASPSAAPVAALSPTTGVPLSWNPGADGIRGVLVIQATPAGLGVGGDFPRTNGVGHNEFALFRGTT